MPRVTRLFPGDIVLFARATGLNRLITFVSRSPYYHVAIYAGDNYVIEARPKGVVSRNLKGSIGSHYGSVIPAPAGKGDAALQWARTQIGAKYDRWDTLVIILEHVFTHLHLNYTPPGRFSCGEFVTEAFRQSGVDLFPGRDSAGIDPADFQPLLPPGSTIRPLVEI
ncbi:MAG TPA: hypothetical protein VFJ58_10845 [Armatimonadota bacterium]|nr:hypothetical protein [Armatimonadota bacterium]